MSALMPPVGKFGTGSNIRYYSGSIKTIKVAAVIGRETTVPSNKPQFITMCNTYIASVSRPRSCMHIGEWQIGNWSIVITSIYVMRNASLSASLSVCLSLFLFLCLSFFSSTQFLMQCARACGREKERFRNFFRHAPFNIL